MMLDIVVTNLFRRDLKKLKKQGLDLELLNKVVMIIAERKKLPEKYKDHYLSGNYVGFKECHIRPDWLLIYRVDEEQVNLILSRSGSHSELF